MGYMTRPTGFMDYKRLYIIVLMPFPRHSTVLHCRLHVDTMKRIEEKGDLFSFVDIVIARTRATAHSTSVPRRENPLSIRILQKN